MTIHVKNERINFKTRCTLILLRCMLLYFSYKDKYLTLKIMCTQIKLNQNLLLTNKQQFLSINRVITYKYIKYKWINVLKNHVTFIISFVFI